MSSLDDIESLLGGTEALSAKWPVLPHFVILNSSPCTPRNRPGSREASWSAVLSAARGWASRMRQWSSRWYERISGRYGILVKALAGHMGRIFGS